MVKKVSSKKKSVQKKTAVKPAAKKAQAKKVANKSSLRPRRELTSSPVKKTSVKNTSKKNAKKVISKKLVKNTRKTKAPPKERKKPVKSNVPRCVTDGCVHWDKSCTMDFREDELDGTDCACFVRANPPRHIL